MKAFIINTFKSTIAVLFMLGTLAVHAGAQEYSVNGLLMGAGSGTLVGQAIGRDTEATLIGTAVGGILGYAIGNEMDNAYAGSYGVAQPVTFRTQVFPNHHGRICRNFVVVERRHGHYREVVKTVCRDRHVKHFRNDHRRHFFDDRHHFRGDHRHHFRGDHRPHFRGDHRHHFRDDRKHFRGDRRHHFKDGNRHHRW